MPPVYILLFLRIKINSILLSVASTCNLTRGILILFSTSLNFYFPLSRFIQRERKAESPFWPIKGKAIVTRERINSFNFQIEEIACDLTDRQ